MDGRLRRPTTYFNRQGTEYTGLPPRTNYDWDWVNLVHPDDADRARGWEYAAVRTRVRVDYRIRRFDGVFRWHGFRTRPCGTPAGDRLWIGTATDIEDQ